MRACALVCRVWPRVQKLDSRARTITGCSSWRAMNWWCQGAKFERAPVFTTCSLNKAVFETRRHALYVRPKTLGRTLGQHAEHEFLLVRTEQDVKQQEVFSFLLIDMEQRRSGGRIILHRRHPEVKKSGLRM